MKTIHIDDDIHLKFSIRARIEDKTIIKLVEEIMVEYLEKTRSSSEEYLKKMSGNILKEYKKINSPV